MVAVDDDPDLLLTRPVAITSAGVKVIFTESPARAARMTLPPIFPTVALTATASCANGT